MRSYAFLFWAYNVIWLALAGYLLLVIVRLRRVSRRLDGIERALEATRQESSDS